VHFDRPIVTIEYIRHVFNELANPPKTGFAPLVSGGRPQYAPYPSWAPACGQWIDELGWPGRRRPREPKNRGCAPIRL